MVAFVYRMNNGIPGDLTRQSIATVESQLFDSATPFSAYGLPGKIDSNGKFAPVGSGDTSASVYGFLVRPFPVTGVNATDPLGTSVPPTSGPASILKRGYINVKINAGTAAINSPVYFRTANPSGAKVVGGIEATLEWGSSSAPKTGGNTGNGTLVLDATTPVLANAIPGVYIATAITATTNAATFRVVDPLGRVLGDVSYSGSGASATFADQIKFVVTDGSTDFVVGDAFNITVVGNTTPITNCFFMSAADASGNAEIAFNL